MSQHYVVSHRDGRELVYLSFNEAIVELSKLDECEPGWTIVYHCFYPQEK